MKSALRASILLSAALFIAAGCNALAALPTPTALPSPTPAPSPTPTAVPLDQQVRLTSVASQQNIQPGNYQLTVQTPTLSGSTDPRVKAFNDEIQARIAGAIADYQSNLNSAPPVPVSANSFFDVKYELVSPAGNVYSIRLETLGYVSGAAHPYQIHYAFNFDLERGKDVALSDLFLSGADFLGTLSKYCAAQLSTRDIDFKDFSQGADPTPDNYKVWNIAPEGLLITFDEYQVAPYAAGAQTVTVPYSLLMSMIDPNGPLAGFAK